MAMGVAPEDEPSASHQENSSDHLSPVGVPTRTPSSSALSAGSREDPATAGAEWHIRVHRSESMRSDISRSLAAPPDRNALRADLEYSIMLRERQVHVFALEHADLAASQRASKAARTIAYLHSSPTSTRCRSSAGAALDILQCGEICVISRLPCNRWPASRRSCRNYAPCSRTHPAPLFRQALQSGQGSSIAAQVPSPRRHSCGTIRSRRRRLPC